ncbi:MAG: hypothetical protein ABI846_09840 [Rudaea sp.]
MIDSPSTGEKAPLPERILSVLAYPKQSGPLSTIVALAVSHAVVGLLPSLIAWLGAYLVWAAFFKYAFEVLRWSANGREIAPEISFTVGDSIGGFAVLLLLLVEVLISLVGSWYGVGAALGVGLVVVFALPAMMIVLALEEGALRALNPVVWIQIATRIGYEYLLPVGFFCAALITQSAVAMAIGSVLPGMLTTLLVFCVVNYLMIANFHLIGAVIHEHADELGYTGHLELQEEVGRLDPARQSIDIARSIAAGGDVEGAAALLREELIAHPDALAMHDEYRHWLTETGDGVQLAAHGKAYVPILLRGDHLRRAVDVARESTTADPKFALDEADDVSRLAKAAANAGDTQLALAQLGGFHKRFRGHPDIARNYLLAAKLLAERMNKEMPARALLHQIKLAAPDDPVIPEVDAYLAFLDKLAATPAQAAAPPP